MKKRGQVWSFDSIMATVIFVSAISAFIVLVSTSYTSTSVETLQSDAETIPQILLASNQSQFSIMDGNKVDLQKLKYLQSEDYQDLRKAMGVRSEFCIFFEDNSGNLINLSALTATGDSVGIGSSDINLTGKVICMK
jgi:long-subunit acyl-CoA synthetase (AMP-forming)